MKQSFEKLARLALKMESLFYAILNSSHEVSNTT